MVIIEARFQLTWMFPEAYDTDGEAHFLPRIKVTDMPCNDNEVVPCFEVEEGLGDNWWSLDNDFRFDTQPGKIEPSNCATARITTILRTMKPSSVPVKPSVFLDVFSLLRTKPRRRLALLMSSSETTRTIGAPQPEKTVNSVWTCSFHRFAQAVLTCD